MRNIFTVDVEDWYQLTLEKLRGGKGELAYPNERVENQTLRVLDLLDLYGVKATFFILGTVAEKFPRLVGAIAERGHEVGSHGYAHRLVYRQTPEQFADDVRRSIRLLKAITVQEIVSYRAPCFSITRSSLWAYDELANLGIEYSSSVYPIKRRLYGIPTSPRFAHNVRQQDAVPLIEVPAATLRMFGVNLPVAGGGYLRLSPYCFTRKAISRINGEKQPAVVYLHPYELEEVEPLLEVASMSAKKRLWLFGQNLGRRGVEVKLNGLLGEFEFGTIRDVLGRTTEGK